MGNDTYGFLIIVVQRWLHKNLATRPQQSLDRMSPTKAQPSEWQKLQADIIAGKVSKIVCWRLDRLGRTAKGLTALFEDLQGRHVGLISLKDGLGLSTPAGRLMANVLAPVAQYETEVRGERVRVGQAAARAAGKTWGGSEKGRRVKVTPQRTRIIQQMEQDRETVVAIAKATGLSRPTVYSVLRENGQNHSREPGSLTR